ncbi:MULTISPECIES: hypothetical protein [Chryseobacterium]|uniref:CRISPR-associated protein n=1 Tax=Candidatus Chryseobacterium massiliense TaxID=204089 RepID=A0A3D9AMV2_9FLAO|nr:MULTISPECIES: hypothetical protein [Chryseobacterium]REC42664.1 hypothetical protein DRF68_17560 [Candidatus Chryseobacterium massiliae]
MNNFENNLTHWNNLAMSGEFDNAQKFYYDQLFDTIIEKFVTKHEGSLQRGGLLFSMLGFSPEPIILSARLIQPDSHVIFTTNNKESNNSGDIIERFLEHSYSINYLSNEDFNIVYSALKETVIQNPKSQIVIDITGGKKSMVAAAAIFGKDFGCNVIYVDFEHYIKELRKPLPGSEMMKLVYSPNINQPEIFL